MNINTITIHPRSMDYPIWRAQLQWFSPYFDKNIVVFSGAVDDYDYSSFVREGMGTIQNKMTFIEGEAPRGDQDWRDVAVNQALKESNSEWVLFLEQDFFWKSRNFLQTVLEATQDYDAIGFWEANRLHPAFLLVKRDFIEKTQKDFSVHHDIQLDHFGIFARDLVAAGARIGELEKLGLKMGESWYHLQGLTHNYSLCKSGDLTRIFKKDEFLTYNKKARNINERQSDKFIELSIASENMLGRYEPQEWLNDFWEFM